MKVDMFNRHKKNHAVSLSGEMCAIKMSIAYKRVLDAKLICMS